MQHAFFKPLKVLNFKITYTSLVSICKFNFWVYALYITIRGTTHHHKTHGHKDEYIPQKLNLLDRSTAVHQQFLRQFEEDQC
jgi:hypothetical protein